MQVAGLLGYVVLMCVVCSAPKSEDAVHLCALLILPEALQLATYPGGPSNTIISTLNFCKGNPKGPYNAHLHKDSGSKNHTWYSLWNQSP